MLGGQGPPAVARQMYLGFGYKPFKLHYLAYLCTISIGQDNILQRKAMVEADRVFPIWPQPYRVLIYALNSIHSTLIA